MIVFTLTASTLLAAFLLHLAWWRVKLPVPQLKALLMIFGVFFLAARGSGGLLPPCAPFASNWLGWLCFSVVLFHRENVLGMKQHGG